MIAKREPAAFENATDSFESARLREITQKYLAELQQLIDRDALEPVRAARKPAASSADESGEDLSTVAQSSERVSSGSAAPPPVARVAARDPFALETPGLAQPTPTLALERLTQQVLAQLGRFLAQIESRLHGAAKAPAPSKRPSAPAPVLNHWKNLNLVLPISFAAVSVDASGCARPADSAASAFPVFYAHGELDAKSKAAAAFNRQKIMTLFSAHCALAPAVVKKHNALYTRIAVIHKCPDFVVSFIGCLAQLLIPSGMFDSAICLKCTKLSRCSVHMKRRCKADVHPHPRFSNWLERIDAYLETFAEADAQKLALLRKYLSQLEFMINQPIQRYLTNWYKQHVSVALPVQFFNSSNEALMLELRWAPAQHMKCILGYRNAMQPSSFHSRAVNFAPLFFNELFLIKEHCCLENFKNSFNELVGKDNLLRDTHGEEVRIALSY